MLPHSTPVSACKDKSSSAPPLASNGVTVASQTPGPTAQPTQRNEPSAQLSQSSNSVRQMLQDEMFKLVQVSTSPFNPLSLHMVFTSGFKLRTNFRSLTSSS